ncbi:MAG: DUF1992 domain-containing protein [Rhodobacteraceae bacterium]|nr:DUF1992 domain-containing protein [Paracoccaceae bacterium]MBR9823568.1 DUF1992 domain-containing protein [Paracoccaceae bacterium]
MDHPLIDLIHARIAEAEARGEFDDLPGAGKPLPRLDDPEAALLDRLAQEAGAVPEFVTLTRRLAALREELRETSDRDRRQQLLREISTMDARIDLARQAHLR